MGCAQLRGIADDAVACRDVRVAFGPLVIACPAAARHAATPRPRGFRYRYPAQAASQPLKVCGISLVHFARYETSVSKLTSNHDLNYHSVKTAAPIRSRRCQRMEHGTTMVLAHNRGSLRSSARYCARIRSDIIALPTHCSKVS
jgi:hypothetical protein